MVNGMKKSKKWLLLLSVIGALIPGLPCEAKYEETHEVELIDMGHGIWVPSSFDVVDENGNFVTLSNLDASFLEKQEIDTENYSITLDNGYRAERQWIRSSPTSNVGYSRTVIYNDNNETVFVLGSESGKIVFGMQDNDGNYVMNTYSYQAVVDYIDPETVTRSKASEDGNSIVPLTRTTYNSEEQVCKTYKSWGDKMQLHEKYDFASEDGPTCTVYGKVNTMYNSYDQEDEYYESYSYKKEDMQSYTVMTMVMVYGVGPMYQPYTVTVPSKITQHGEELQIYWLQCSFEGVTDWVDDENTSLTEEARAGRPIDMKFYFTKEQIEIIESEGITTVEELQSKYPEFMDTFGGFTDTYVGKYEESEAETETTPEYNGNWKTLPNGTKVCWQNLTGDVVPINGMIPTAVMSQEFETPSGMRQSVILYDDSGNIVMHCMFFDMSHTNYKYVYLTRVDLALNMAEIAGTNEPVSGNLNYLGESTYDTENGQVTDDVYGEYYYEPGGEY